MAATATTSKTTKPKPKTTRKPRASTTPKAKAPVTPIERVQATAEKAVLVQLGAALIARDHVVGAVTGIAGTDLKTAEKRGKTARTKAEARARKARRNLSTATKRNRVRVAHDTAALRKSLDDRIAPVREASQLVADRVTQAFPALRSS